MRAARGIRFPNAEAAAHAFECSLGLGDLFSLQRDSKTSN